jgi:hypothetical protein
MKIKKNSTLEWMFNSDCVGILTSIKTLFSQTTQGYLLAFWVTPKVFTSCLGLLHMMWVAWCMDDPCLYRDGHTLWSWLTL